MLKRTPRKDTTNQKEPKRTKIHREIELIFMLSISNSLEKSEPKNSNFMNEIIFLAFFDREHNFKETFAFSFYARFFFW